MFSTPEIVAFVTSLFVAVVGLVSFARRTDRQQKAYAAKMHAIARARSVARFGEDFATSLYGPEAPK